jgi:hypothetical protein
VLMVGTVKTLGNLQSPSNEDMPFNHKQVPLLNCNQGKWARFSTCNHIVGQNC